MECVVHPLKLSLSQWCIFCTSEYVPLFLLDCIFRPQIYIFIKSIVFVVEKFDRKLLFSIKAFLFAVKIFNQEAILLFNHIISKLVKSHFVISPEYLALDVNFFDIKIFLLSQLFFVRSKK